MTKELNGAELAGFIKERQRREVARITNERGRVPRLMILRDNDTPVIAKYVSLKKRYGEDIGVEVVDKIISPNALSGEVDYASHDIMTDGIIVQLPLTDTARTDEIVARVAPEKDVDALAGGRFTGATALAIDWLLSGYNIDMSGKIAIVGHGRLVGAPLERLWNYASHDITVFDIGDDIMRLVAYDIIVTATGVPRLIKPEMVKPGAVIVDAGTASEDGVIVGDVDDAVRERGDLKAITPKVGGVGPLTIAALFENLLRATRGD